jgi:prephenate dehydrogenase
VIDLASTKRAIVAAAETAFADSPAAFVGGHPMAGAPAGGPRAAHAQVFESAPFALCPSSVSPPEALERARALVTRLGARPLVIDAQTHDRVVAWSSHLPHVCAAAVALAAGEAPDLPLLRELVGGGFRSTTRVAAGGRRLWTQVLLENRTEVLGALDSLKVAIASLEDALRKDDEETLGGILEFAKHVRGRLAGESDAHSPTLANGSALP